MPNVIRLTDFARTARAWNTGEMGNTAILTAYEGWLLSTRRADGTVRLRMSHVTRLARRHDLATLSTDDLERYLFEIRKQAPETRKSVLSSWRLFFQWARRKGVRDDDPTLDVESVTIPVRVPRVADDDSILRALANADPRERAMILLARYGCLRLAELSTLHTRDRQGDLLRVRGKGDKERLVAANEDLLAALVALEDDQGPGYYFRGQRGPHMHPQSVHKIIKRITGWNPHALRHAGATAAYNATHDLRGVQEMLGHASMATTQRYLHTNVDGLRNVAAATSITTHKLRFAA